MIRELLNSAAVRFAKAWIAPATILAANLAAAQTTVIDFNNISGGSNLSAVPGSYQPLAGDGISVGWNNVGLYNGGPDYTNYANSTSGSNNYSAFQFNNSSPLAISFSSPIGVSSLYFDTYEGEGAAAPITLNAYSDPAGTNLLASYTVTSEGHAFGTNYTWNNNTPFTAFASLGPHISLITAAAGLPNAQLDNITVSAPAAPATPTYTIMPLGDSITYGLSNILSVPNGTVPGGYRYPLMLNLQSAGYSFQFVGSQTANPDANGQMAAAGQTHFEGHSGYRTDQITNNLNGNDGTAGNNGGFWLAGGNGTGRSPLSPNIVLLEIGTNDASQGVSVSTYDQNLTTLLNTLKQGLPSSQIFVANLIPRGDSLETLQRQYNDTIPGIVAGEGTNFHFVDMHSAFPQDGLSGDVVHPNEIGYDWMAGIWANAIEGVVAVPEPSTYLAGAFACGSCIASFVAGRRRSKFDR